MRQFLYNKITTIISFPGDLFLLNLQFLLGTCLITFYQCAHVHQGTLLHTCPDIQIHLYLKAKVFNTGKNIKSNHLFVSLMFTNDHVLDTM